MMQLINVSLGAHGLDPFFQVMGRRMAGTKLSLRRYNVIFFQRKEEENAPRKTLLTVFEVYTVCQQGTEFFCLDL